MSLVKTGQIANCCQPNALMTLAEYLEDYASPETRKKGYEMIEKTIPDIPNEKVRSLTAARLSEIKSGARDFRF